jgi:hypothetical protein
MVLAAELDPERHHDAGDVSPAKDGMAARQRDQLSDRVRLSAILMLEHKQVPYRRA